MYKQREMQWSKEEVLLLVLSTNLATTGQDKLPRIHHCIALPPSARDKECKFLGRICPSEHLVIRTISQKLAIAMSAAEPGQLYLLSTTLRNA